jgi:HK97 family phage portal protein
MTVISSEQTLLSMPSGWWPRGTNSLMLYNNFSADYATLYKTQPNVRTCVDFLARNIAQLGLHLYRRLDNDDRIRVRDHPLALLLNQPLPVKYKVTRYRLIESLLGDLGVYFNAYWLKLFTDGTLRGLLRIPPELVIVTGSLSPQYYTMDLGLGAKDYAPEAVVHFRGYNAGDAVKGLSLLETLRRILAEEYAAGDYRENFWGNAARMQGIIERPADAADWSETARARFKAEFEALYSGSENSGKTAILEEGMTWKQASFAPEEAEYLTGRKLTREECARAYHIPPPLVGILDHATFSNITEQHKNLYTDVLGPWIASIEEDIKLQILPDFEDQKGIYVEFNIAEKLQGDFETQTNSLQSAVGAPWMTRNEGRAVMNLPRVEGGDELVTPLNVLMGGQASPNDSAPGKNKEKKDDTEMELFRMTSPELREKFEGKWRKVLIKSFERQRNAVLPKIKGMNDINLIWDAERWNEELTDDFTPISWDTALAWAKFVAEVMEAGMNEELMRIYVENNARIAASYINQATMEQIQNALLEEDPKSAVQKIFEIAIGVRAVQLAAGRVTALSNYGAYSAARQGGAITKTWVTGVNPRPTHAAMNGETVGMREKFSNGLRWPGDYLGSADETAGCNCELMYGRKV